MEKEGATMVPIAHVGAYGSSSFFISKIKLYPAYNPQKSVEQKKKKNLFSVPDLEFQYCL